MISVYEALRIIDENVFPTVHLETRNLAEAVGFIVSEAVVSPINMPPFRQSAMDGFALHLHDVGTYSVVGEIKAGEAHNPVLKKGEAVRIFTGAAVPDSADAVVMQEKVSPMGDSILLSYVPFSGENIRPLGEQVNTGAVALKKGTRLTPAAIGFLTSIGVVEVKVYQKPSVAIITTGNELVTAGQPLNHGQIYESNASMLSSAIRSLGYNRVSTFKVEDDARMTYDILQTVINENDIVLITGGISVGDYDFVGRTLKELQVEQLFYKVNQKPGKPFFFGRMTDTIVFALPGNPAAALSCFYMYVYTALQRKSGDLNFQLKRTKEKSASFFVKKGGRPQFLKAVYANEKVALLEGQSSAMLQTFAIANALVFVPDDVVEIAPDDIVDVIHLPN